MKSTILFLFATAFITIPASQASLPNIKHVVKLDQIGHLKLGDSIDSLPAISSEKHHARFGKRAHFSFYMFTPNLPPKCMNLQCGPFATKVLRRGGVLLGGAASVYAQDLGTTNSDASSLLLVTDEQDHVTAIYRDISRENFDEVLASLE
jgi:hypothetical protein